MSPTVAPLSLVYRVPDKRVGDVFLRRARAGPQPDAGAGRRRAMRPLFRALKAGELVGITADQQPKLGAGVFAPFFGRQALTLTLIPKLAERSGAPVLLAWAEPVAPAASTLYFEAAPAAIADPDIDVATAAMNAAVEAIARRRMEWYQWTYKRFSKRPKGSGEKNPYFPDCY